MLSIGNTGMLISPAATFLRFLWEVSIGDSSLNQLNLLCLSQDNLLELQ